MTFARLILDIIAWDKNALEKNVWTDNSVFDCDSHVNMRNTVRYGLYGYGAPDRFR